MDLPYPTDNDHQLIERLGSKTTSHLHSNSIDKPRKSTKRLSVQSVQLTQPLTSSNKHRIVTLIKRDKAYSLYAYLEKEAIRLEAQVGSKDTYWNTLHYCSRFNAYQCMEFALKWQYQNRPENYEVALDHRTSQGYTPLMLAVMSHSHETLEVLLRYGGSDLCAFQSSRLTAYDYAVQYNNQVGLQLLMKYEKKHNPGPNKDELSKPLEFTHKNEGCCSDFVDIFKLVFNFGKDDRKSGNGAVKRLSAALNMETYFIDTVPIGSLEGVNQDHDVEWLFASQISRDPECSLFGTYSPLAIKETGYPVGDCLAVLQALCQHPWLVRKAIQVDRTTSNHYWVNLFVNQLHSKINIDGRVPVLRDSKQPLFISNSREIWPMLLQKGLAKAYGGYMNLGQVPTQKLVSSLTGFHTSRLEVQELESVFEFVDDLITRGFYVLLQGRKGSSLRLIGNNNFTVLNCFSKDGKQLMLVNCPFVDANYSQQNEPLALKLMRSHHTAEGQMCAWFDEEGLKAHFSHIVVSCTAPNMERTSISFKAQTQIYFRFTVNTIQDTPIWISLFNNTTEQVYDLSDGKVFASFINDSAKLKKKKGSSALYNTRRSVLEPTSMATMRLAQLPHLPGNYLARINLPANSVPSDSFLSLVIWSQECTQPQFTEESVARLEWTASSESWDNCTLKQSTDHTDGSSYGSADQYEGSFGDKAFGSGVSTEGSEGSDAE